MALLDIKNIDVSYGKRATVQGCSIELGQGQICSVVGESGSGKSVLAHAILGILPGNAIVGGTIRYDGAILDNTLRKKLVGSEIIMIPQSVTYRDPLMKVGKQVRGLTGTEAQQRAAFARYGLKEQVAAMYPHELSGGMTRRVLISTATITDAKLILADEPTPGLSADIAAETMRNFRELADEGRGILMITHDTGSPSFMTAGRWTWWIGRPLSPGETL